MANALIVGATGLIGGYLIEELEKINDFEEIYVLTRREIPLPSKKFKCLVVNFDELHQITLPKNSDTVFCALGTTIKTAGSKEAFEKVDYTYVIATAQLGLRFGAKSFHLVSAIGADANSTFFYNKVKGKTENALRSSGYPSTFIYQPSLLGGERKEFRFGEKVAQLLYPLIQWMFIGKMAKYKMIHGRKVATAMIKTHQSKRTGHLIISSDIMNKGIL